jgi:acyl dehydratase
MPKVLIPSLAALPEWVGREVALSDWVLVDQARIDRFAEATGDHQWIHVDPARAAAESPYGGTIAHGYLTVALIATLMLDSLEVGGCRMVINYGINRLRFLTPVRSGDRVRARFTLAAVEPIKGGVQLLWTVSVEIEGQTKPACAAEVVYRLYE